MENKIYNTLQGWCCPEKRQWLMDTLTALQQPLIVEIGVFGGSSLIPMAVAAQTVKGYAVGIDPWAAGPALEGMENIENKSWWSTIDYEAILNGLKEFIRYHGLSNIELIRDTSDNCVNKFKPESIALLHIDGCHSAGPAMRDTQNYLPLVQKGGYIVWDDCNWHEGGVLTVRPAIDWAMAHGVTLVKEDFGCVIGQKQ